MKCINCQFETSNPRFCSKSCAAKYNNVRYPKRSRMKICKLCKEKIASSRTYCDFCWSPKARSKFNLNQWINGNWRGGSDLGLSEIIRDYLLEKANYCCSKCGFNTPHPDDNRSILEINHIDGNGLNHSADNLEVICPNCHALTSTYRGRNIGKGRPVSYIRKSLI
jgi:hypothetical protein